MAHVETNHKSRDPLGIVTVCVGGPRVNAELVPERRGAVLYEAQLYRCHPAGNAERFVRVYAYDDEHAQCRGKAAADGWETPAIGADKPKKKARRAA